MNIVLPIPTALPIARRDNPDAVFRTKNGTYYDLLYVLLHCSRFDVVDDNNSIYNDNNDDYEF